VAAGTYDIAIEQGATWRLVVICKDESGAVINLTGFVARMQVRRRVRSDTILAELTDTNGGITVTPLLGKLELFLSDDTTAAFAFTHAVYDLEIESSGGETTRVLQGAFTVSLEVTR
jgi:hypothetical protein